MPIDISPAAWIPDWESNGTAVSFPLSSVPALDVDEAHGSTGDIRKVLFALLEKLYDHYQGLPSADVPGNLTLGTANFFKNQSGEWERSYTAKFNLTAGSVDVKD